MVWNKKMMTTEDANSIVEHFTKWCVDYYTLDTRLLTTSDTIFAYDFIEIYKTSGSIAFKVNNGLWTGGFRVVDCNVESPTVSVGDGTITVSKTGLEWVVLLLEISPSFNHGDIFELDYTVEYTPVIRPFYEDIALTMGFLDGETPVSGLSFTDKTNGGTVTSDEDGLVTVVSSASDCTGYGLQDYWLQGENNSVTVNYHFPYYRLPLELPVKLVNSKVFKDKLNVLSFEFLLDDEYTLPLTVFDDVSVRLRVNGVYYNVNVDGLSFDVPVGLEDYLDLRLEINGNSFLDDYVVDYRVVTEYVSFDNGADLKVELESDGCAGTVLFTGTSLSDSISVVSDVIVRFSDTVSSSLDNVFLVGDGVSLTLENCQFTGKGLINSVDGKVILTGSGFTHCTDSIVTGTGDLTVDTCSFVDNYSCIDFDGRVELSNTLFDLSDNSYLDTGTPAFVRCYQDLLVDFCRFNLQLDGLTSLGLSYVMLYLGRNGTVNKTANNTLLRNEVFPIGRNTGTVDVESTHYHIRSKNSKCMVWSIQDTNTVYSNNLEVEYV